MPSDYRWVLTKDEFLSFIASKRHTAPGPDGIPYDIYAIGGGIPGDIFYQLYVEITERLHILLSKFETLLVVIPKGL